MNDGGAHIATSVIRFASVASVSSASVELVATLYEPAPAGASGTAGASSSDDGSTGGRPLPGLIVGHGAGSRRERHDRFCRAACSAGMVVLALDFRGHGDSGGILDGPGELDLVAATTYLRDLGHVDGARICYRGSSLGGYFGLQAANIAGFAAMALVCPATETVMLNALEGAFDEDQARERGLDLRADVDALRAYFSARDVRESARTIECDVLFVHARGDTVVPLESSLELARLMRGRTDLMLLPGGDHSSAQASQAVDRLTVAWLLAHATRGRTGD